MKSLSLKKQFNEARAYLNESAMYIYTVVAMFLLSAIIGFIFRDNLTFLNRLIQELLERSLDLNTIEMIFFILQNNLQSSLFSILFGIIFGIFPIFSSVSNGLVLGYVLGLSYEVSGLASWWRLLPHGIFELPAIFISFGLGLKLGLVPFSKKRNKIKELKRRLYNSINALLTIIIPLLIIAAIIEGLLIGLLS